ncbi:MAG: nitric oxide reductase large subunit [Deltaproteobacteria bacterium HGW-Deltaproteobacteria-14]|jgi:nitric oxide reductase subunit B|nr:MAG: nitric oxide reductase large subunit [Deltaproteobacteria bacterium HGW-Deltaproteobacteria-14]
MQNKRLWVALAIVMAGSFTVLGMMGREIYREAPPIPAQVVADDGAVLFTRAELDLGKTSWQAMGGQQIGSIWGHGAYQAPDWSADWLHREAVVLLDLWAVRDHGAGYDALPADTQAALRERLRRELRTNTYDPATGVLRLSDDRARAVHEVAAHYDGLFGHDPALDDLRAAYAIPVDSVKDPARRAAMNGFFFWTAWACAAERPGADISYTNNWPAESLIGNAPTSASVLWSILSVVVLLLGIGGLVWFMAAKRKAEPLHVVPDRDPLLGLVATPSMRATKKYFWTAIALFLTQVGLGAITAHYGVEGDGFFGVPLDQILPYTVARTWHTQLGIFWIATTWVATGLYIAPAVSGHEPRWQRLGVNVLYVCLLIIVVGSMAGEYLSVQQQMDLDATFWFGHQGYEYVDLGRFWQAFLFVGLLLWLVLVGRALWPALRRKDDNRQITVLLFLSTIAIGLFYGAGLMWGKGTHLAVAEYWRWWVVHLWVEGFFEVFATAVIAFLFARLGLVRTGTATSAILFSTIIFLAGGIIGTAHHLYFTGTPVSVLALGSVFSALEIVPLVLIGFEALETFRHASARPWVRTYKWPILFFVAVAFWNLVGAGIFGFLINPPIALYYMQGLNTTSVHGHTALFGVYGMLGIGLMLFCLRGLSRREAWSDPLLKWSFWSFNAGLLLMVLLSLLPIGIIQASASVEHGLWYARSAELLQQPYMQTLRWLRVPGDVLFSVGVFGLALFALRLWRRGRTPAAAVPTDDATDAAPRGKIAA